MQSLSYIGSEVMREMIDPFDEIIIRNYFSLDLSIWEQCKYYKRIHREFYMQTMVTHMELHRIRVSTDEYQMVTKGFRPDREVEKLLHSLEIIDRRIARNIFRKKHFEDFLADLPEEDLERLESRYRKCEKVEISLTLLSLVLDEIDEIEAALCYRAGIEPDPKNTGVDLLEDTDQNLERMCDFFAI